MTRPSRTAVIFEFRLYYYLYRDENRRLHSEGFFIIVSIIRKEL
jgi:hypothetical protein